MPDVISPESTLAEIVNEHPALARELERRSLDYCCGGQRSLAEACEAAGLDPEKTASELGDIGSPDPEPWVALGPAELADHLEATHHRYLQDELPRLSALALKVREVHGDAHSELADVERTYTELRFDLEPHLEKEEQILFPMIRELVASERAPEFHCGSLANPISVMLTEHDRAGELFAQLRSLTNDYTPPADGCESYRALYDGLAQLEADTHMHIHKENNLLFPATVELERSRSA